MQSTRYLPRSCPIIVVSLLISSMMAVSLIPAVRGEPVEVMTDLPPLTVQTAGAGVVVGDDHNIYVFGGYQYNFTAFDAPMSLVSIYNTTTGTTTYGTSMQNGVAWPSCVKLRDGRIAIIGGYNSAVQNDTSAVRIYNPRTDTWTTNASAPRNISKAGSALGADGKVYVFGPINYQNSTFVYDPVADSWSYGSDLPGGRSRYGSSAVTYNDTMIYVIGGSFFFYIYMPPGIWVPVFDDTNFVDIYNPVNGTWTTCAPLNRDKEFGGAALARNGYIYYFGGQGMLGLVYDDIERYDPREPIATASWQLSQYTISKPKSHFGTATDDHGRVFLVGGREYPSWAHIPDVEMVIAAEVTEVNEISITSPTDGGNVSGLVEVAVCLKNQLAASPVTIDLGVDGELVETQLGGSASSWTFQWNASEEQNGTQHDISIEALFSDGSVSSDEISVWIGPSEEGNLDQMLLDIQEELAYVASALGDLSDQVQLLSDSVDNISANMSTLADIQAGLDALLDDYLALAEAVEGMNVSASSDLADLESQMDSIMASLADLQAALATLEDEQGGLSGWFGDLVEKIEELLNSTLENLTENANAIDDVIDSTNKTKDSSSEARTYALIAAVASSIGLVTAAAALVIGGRKRG